ncbi:MAG: hypothetical protein AAF550_05385 [Myxococcota bacterium]
MCGSVARLAAAMLSGAAACGGATTDMQTPPYDMQTPPEQEASRPEHAPQEHASREHAPQEHASRERSPIDLLPPDTVRLATFNVARFLDSSHAQDVIDLLYGQAGDVPDPIKANAWLFLTQTSKIVLGQNEDGDGLGPPLIILQGNYDPKLFLALLESNFGPVTTELLGQRTVYSRDGVFVFAADEVTWVAGSSGLLDAALNRPSGSASLVTRTDTEAHLFTYAFEPSLSLRSELIPNISGLSDSLRQYVTYAVLYLDIEDGIRCAIEVSMDSAERAEQLTQEIQALIDGQRSNLMTRAMGFGPIIDGTFVLREGETVKVHARLSEEDTAMLLERIEPLFELLLESGPVVRVHDRTPSSTVAIQSEAFSAMSHEP